MNKYSSFLLLLTVAMGGVLTSCSQDELVMQAPVEADAAHAQKLEFYLDVETRGEDVTLQNLDTIYVFGTYLDQTGKRQSCFSTQEYAYGFVPFIRTSKKESGKYDSTILEDHYYRPATDMYWDEAWPETCQFFAMNVKPNLPFYGEDKDATYRDGELGTVKKNYAFMKAYSGQNTFSVINFFQPCFVKDQIDVVYANNTEATKAGSRTGIPLSFKHVYSAFDVQFKQSAISDYKVKIYGADFVQRTTGGHWFDLRDNSFTSGFVTYSGYAGELGNILLGPDGGYLEVSEEPKRLNDSKPYAYLFPTLFEVKSPTTDGDLFKYPRAAYWGNEIDAECVFLKLYLTVEDKNGNVIYPTVEDLKNGWRNKNAVTSKAPEKLTKYDFWDKVGIANISLGKDFEAKAGSRYSITVDLTYGVGYFNPDDPAEDGSVPGESGQPYDRGGLPILGDHLNADRPIGANVYIKDFNIIEGLTTIEPNKPGTGVTE